MFGCVVEKEFGTRSWRTRRKRQISERRYGENKAEGREVLHALE